MNLLKHEIEVKFFIIDCNRMVKKLDFLGKRITKNHLETNIVYEDIEHTLFKKNMLIRLRNSNKTTLTLKMPAKIKTTEFKINQEIEVNVSDCKRMNLILELMGYHKEHIYEKWREVWEIEETLIFLDTMPYGCFLEIEGLQSKIKTVAKRLGLNWQNKITSSYLEIFQIIKEKESLNFNDLKFTLFKKETNLFFKYRNLFEKRT